jgi:hypothetical protein
MGRGVRPKSWLAAMLYHQNRLAVVKEGSRRLPASQTFSPPTRRFDWRQNHTSIRSRNSQPLATMPCSRGSSPVMKVACTEQVTAGVTVVSGRAAPALARALSLGVWEPR